LPKLFTPFIMTDQLILNQLQQLPDNLKLEVADFIGYLLKKHSLPATKPIGKPKKSSRKNGGSLKAGLANEEIDEAIRIVRAGCDMSDFGDALQYQMEARRDRALPYRD